MGTCCLEWQDTWLAGQEWLWYHGKAKASTPISRIRGCDETSILVNGYLAFTVFLLCPFQRRTGVTGHTLIVWGDDKAEHLMLEKQEVMTKTFDRRGKIKIGLVGDWKRRVNK